MSVDDRLHRGLSSAWDEVDRDGVEDHLQAALQAGRRRRRMYGAVSLVAVFAVVAVAIAAPRIGARLFDEPTLHPIGPTEETDDPAPFDAIAGTWTTVIPGKNRAAKRLGFDGRWVMKLNADGTARVVSHPEFDSQFLPRGITFTFSLSGDRFTTGIFSDDGHCLPRENKTYRWHLEDGDLSFDPEDDPCIYRRVMLTSSAWHRR